jgi:hypothetical protein
MGKYVRLEHIAPGRWRVYYGDVFLGYLHEKQIRLLDDQGPLRRTGRKV